MFHKVRTEAAAWSSSTGVLLLSARAVLAYPVMRIRLTSILIATSNLFSCIFQTTR